MYHTLEDFIRQEGAPDALLSDNAKAQIGKNVQQILRMYCIADFKCEPHYQHQNYAERRFTRSRIPLILCWIALELLLLSGFLSCSMS